MTPPEIRAARLRLGWSQGQAARLFGVDGRTWRRWEDAATTHGRDMPPSAVLLLRACLEMPRLLRWLERQSTQHTIGNAHDPR